MKKEIITIGAQTFTPKAARVTGISKYAHTFLTEQTGELTRNEVFYLNLDNGETLVAPLNAIGRALSVMLPENRARIVIGADIEYYTTRSVAGQEFRWRPTDRNTVVATSTREFTSIDLILPLDRYWDVLDTLPVYAIEKDDTMVPKDEHEEEQEEEQEEEEVPEGAVIDTNVPATGTKKNAKAVVA